MKYAILLTTLICLASGAEVKHTSKQESKSRSDVYEYVNGELSTNTELSDITSITTKYGNFSFGKGMHFVTRFKADYDVAVFFRPDGVLKTMLIVEKKGYTPIAAIIIRDCGYVDLDPIKIDTSTGNIIQ